MTTNKNDRSDNLNKNLKNILAQYAQKRESEIEKARQKKNDIYQRNPRLQEIDDELSSYTIATAKTILKTNDTSLLQNLNKKY